MTHLYIELTESSTEEVSSGVIKKLYDMALAGLDSTSNLKGTLHTTVASSRDIAYLTGLFPNLHITADEYTITFEDAEFERICISNWGSNGAVTANLLAAVTNAGYNTFAGNTNIIKANDLVYFTGLTGLNNCPRFVGCTNLQEITIPSNLHDLQAGFLTNCSSLTTINGLDHVQTVLNSPLSGCSSLTSLVFTSLTGICNIGEMTKSALTNVEINEGCTEFKLILRNGGPTTFNVPSTVRTFTFTCKTLTTITFAANSLLKETQNNGGFCECNNLTTINNFPWDTWTTMGSYCFCNCNSLTGTIKTPVGQTNIPDNALTGLLSIDSIIVDSAVTSIGVSNFSRVKTGAKIIMNPTTPPTLSHSVGGFNYGYNNTTGCVFYVPDASYNDYISNGGQYWTELYNNGRIKKQSELPS